MALTKVDDRGLKTPIDLQDNEKIRLGTANDLELYHDGSTASIFRAKAGDQLSLQADTIWFRNAANSETTAKFFGNGANELYYDNSKKLETSSSGTTITGNLIANTASGRSTELHASGIGIIRDSKTLDLNANYAGGNTHAQINSNQSQLRLGISNSDTLRVTADSIILQDNKKAIFGNSDDLEIYHSSNVNFIDSSTEVRIRGTYVALQPNGGGQQMALGTAGGSFALFHNGNQKLETTSGGIAVTGDVLPDVTDGRNLGSSSKKWASAHLKYNLYISDNGIARFGDSSDLQIFHDGTNSFIKDTGTGGLKICASFLGINNAANNEAMIVAAENGSVDLYYNNSKKLETTSAGATVTGTLTATAFSGDGIIPAGGIIIWSGASNAIPTGWLLCDGSNSTPDLRGRFVVGHHPSNGDYDVGDTGGAESVTLTTAQIPSHNHPIQIRTGIDDNNFSFNQGFSSDRNDSGGTFNSNNTGGGQSHENRPPYYALCYIMKS